jgi:hypothetical protein
MAQERGSAALMAQRRERRRRQRSHRLGEGGRGRGVAWWAGSSYLATGPIGPKVEENFFSDKNCIFEYIKALKICTRRFRRNLDTRIFPKFF